MTDDWRSVDEALYWLDQRSSWHPVVAAMRALRVALESDARLHDLRPSMSHDALVLRRRSNPGVWVCWHLDDDAYEVAFIDPGFALRDRSRATSVEACVTLVSRYLERSPRPDATDTTNPTGWEAVDAEYRQIEANYPSEAAFASAMRSITAILRDDVRFAAADPRVARGAARAGGPVGSLVLGLLARRCVWCWWDATEPHYRVALVEGDVTLHAATGTGTGDTIELLAADLARG